MNSRKTRGGLRATLNRRNALFAITVSIAALGTTAIMATAPKHVPQEVSEKVWPVTTLTVEPGRFTPELQAFGRVESRMHTRLSSALDAPVLQVHFSEGDSVRAGEPLVTLDASESQLIYAQRAADLAGKQATLDSLESDFSSEKRVFEQMQELLDLAAGRVDRLTDLYASKMVSTTEVDTLKQELALRRIELARQQSLVESQPQRLAGAQAAVDSAKAALAEQGMRLAASVLRAPFDGRITSVDVSDGARVQPGKILIALYDLQKLRVRARLPSRLAPELKLLLSEGTQVTARIEGSEQVATLKQLSSEVEKGSSGINALLELPANSSLEVGRTVEITLQMPALHAVVSLPRQSIYEENFVYVVEKQRLKRVPVDVLGSRKNESGDLELLVNTSQLHAGTEIMISDLPEAREGLLVEASRRELAGTDAWIM